MTDDRATMRDDADSSIPHRLTALVVEDDESLREVVCWILEEVGYDTLSAGELTEARGLLDSCHPSVMVLDLNLGEDWGGDLLRELSTRPSAPPTLVLSASREASHVTREFDVALVPKPFEVEQLERAVRLTRRQRRRPTAHAARP